LSSLQVTDFTDQYHAGVVTQDGSQAGRKGQTDLGMYLDLVDAFQLVLNWILGGNDLVVFRLDLAQGTVQRRRFTRTGRPSDQYDTVRQANQLLKFLVDRLRHTHATQIEFHIRFVED